MADMSAQVLVVDDDAAVCWALDRALSRAGYRVAVCGTTADARRRIAQAPPALVLTDQRMPGGSGLDLLGELHRDRPRLPVVLMTAHGSLETASRALAAGAYDYLPKPLDLDRTLAVVERALGRRELALEVAPARHDGPVLVGASPALQEAVRRLALAAASDLPLLITGPTGSGKELAARLVHHHSRRTARPLIPVTSGVFAAGDPVAALFGRDGLLTAAAGGALLFDEVGDLTPELQTALLAALARDPPADVRILAATGRDLAATPGFRPELRHRLAVLTVDMPALAARSEDLPLLAGHLLGRISARLDRPLALTEAALAALQARSWPGNVRELRGVLEEAAALAPGGTIDAEHLRGGAAASPPSGRSPAEAERCLDEHPGAAHARWTEAHERTLFAAAIARTRGNVLRAAELLGLHRSTLRKRLDELGLAAPSEG